jgi:hypothetical protein
MKRLLLGAAALLVCSTAAFAQVAPAAANDTGLRCSRIWAGFQQDPYRGLRVRLAGPNDSAGVFS